mgnify:CR=1 FL=1
MGILLDMSLLSYFVSYSAIRKGFLKVLPVLSVQSLPCFWLGYLQV